MKYYKSFTSLVSVESEGNTAFLRAARAGQYDKVLEYLNSNIDINTSNSNGLNALHLASKDGHYEIVSELLKRGAKVDLATKKGNTALHIASLAGKEEVVKLLIRNGATVNVQSQNGFTPLYMAAQENHENVVKFLLANGANQSLSTEDGFTPLAVAMQQGHDKIVALLLENDTRGKVRLPALHIAAKKDDVKAARLLLENEHNPDVTSKSGFTPLHIAAHYGNDTVGELLIEKHADVNYAAKHNITPLHVAAKWGKLSMMELLLNNNATIETKTRDGLTPLHCAARSGHDPVVDLLLERNAPISSKTKNGLAPLHMATQGDHVEAARILLNNHAPVDDVTVDYLTALHVAAHCGHVKVAKLLLDKGADSNSRALNGFTPLHIACKKNRIKVVELLLKHGANISATTESGLTPLHVASFMGCMNIVIFLLQHNASPDAPTVRGETPLHLAARSNQTDIIRILLRNGAQVDARAREQQTPLHIASRLGNVDIVMLLLQHGAKIDSATKDMYTALHIAAKEGQEEVAGVLIDNEAEIDAKTTKGFTPLHLSSKYGHVKIVDLLLQKNAQIDAQGKNLLTPLHVAIHYDRQEVAKMLLDHGASVHLKAKNGYTPLHIAAKRNQVYIGQNLLIAKADPNDPSKAGFIPLHLSAQEGHYDLCSLLISHKSDANYQSNNGLTPLHLASQEDRVDVTKILLENNADINATTSTGYTPLHIASHFGHLNMVRYLITNGADVNCATDTGYTPLHQAAQQGHVAVVNLLLENSAQPNVKNINDQTPLQIAQKLGYISVIETLKVVTNLPAGSPMLVDEKYKVLAPERMQETFFTDSEEEGGDEVFLEDQPYRYLTVDEMKSLGDDSLPIDVTRDEKMDSNRMINSTDSNIAIEDSTSPQMFEKFYSENLRRLSSVDNVDLSQKQQISNKGFLVSFLVDARGGAMRGCRHSGIRMIIPPQCASSPTRITCRYVKPQKALNPPPLMEGEALVSRILELGPSGVKFLGPIILDVPHFASIKNHEREIVILRSDNGETWREHVFDYPENNIQDILKSNLNKEELDQIDDPNAGRVTRIVTLDLPQYFAIVSRVRQEVHAIGPDGGMISSVVVPQVQAIFPQGALTKKIKVGLQVQPVDAELTAKLLGHGVAVSPIVTIEPRRRKFHKAITLSIPTPQAHTQGMINQYSGSAPTLRLLCSITGGTTRAQWEDVTGSTPLTFINDNVSFTTTVSARFWLIDCRNVNESTKMATELYREVIYVPFMARFVVFSKRIEPMIAKLRVFCMTDDSEDKTLENQENFIEIAKSRDVEVFENKPIYIEFSGNLVPITKSGEQLQFIFKAFRENRLPFTTRIKDPNADLIGRCMFMREPKVLKGDPPQQPICVLNVVLPETIISEVSSEIIKSYQSLLDSYLSGDYQISEIANFLGTDWPKLAYELAISKSDTENIKSQYQNDTPAQIQAMIKLWMSETENKYQDEEFEKALKRLGRQDISKMLTTRNEVKKFKSIANQKGFKRKDYLDVLIYEDRDLMKESESLESLIQSEKCPEKQQIETLQEIEEKKYIGEEKEILGQEEEPEIKKSVAEIRYDIEKRLSEDIIIPPSTQKVEIVQEISEIRQQSLVEEKMQGIEQQQQFIAKVQKNIPKKSSLEGQDVTKAKKDDHNQKSKIESKIPLRIAQDSPSTEFYTTTVTTTIEPQHILKSDTNKTAASDAILNEQSLKEMNTESDQQALTKKEKKGIFNSIKKVITEPKKSHESLENIKETASHFIEKIVNECEQHLHKERKVVDHHHQQQQQQQSVTIPSIHVDLSKLDSAMDEVNEIILQSNQQTSITKIDKANDTIDNFNLKLNEIENELMEKRNQRKKEKQVLDMINEKVIKARTNLDDVNLRIAEYFNKINNSTSTKYPSAENIRDEVEKDIRKNFIHKKNSQQFENNTKETSSSSSSKISEQNIDLSSILIKTEDSSSPVHEKKCLFQLDSEDEISFDEIKPTESEGLIDLSTNDEGLMSQFFREQEDILRHKLSLLEKKFNKLASTESNINQNSDRESTNITNKLTENKNGIDTRKQFHEGVSKKKIRSSSIISSNVFEDIKTHDKPFYNRSSSLPFNKLDKSSSSENSPKNFTSSNLFKYKITEGDNIPSDSMEVQIDRSETEESIVDDVNFEIKFGTENIDETVWEESENQKQNLIKSTANEILKEIEDKISNLQLIRRDSFDEISAEDLKCVEEEDSFYSKLNTPEIQRAFSEDYTANANKVFKKVIKFADSRRSISVESDVEHIKDSESYYQSCETTKSRPCSSDVEALITAATTMTSDYDTALSYQDIISKSADYHTAVSSVESKDSIKSISSESSGNLGSMETSDLSETLVPSTKEDDDSLENDEVDNDNILPLDEPQTTKMKRSFEMTFQPTPKPITESKKCHQHKRQDSMSAASIKSAINDPQDTKKFNEPAVFNLPLTTTTISSKCLIEPIVEDDIAEKIESIEKKPILVPSKDFTDILMPDIKITQHLAPIVDSKFYYPEVELEKMNEEFEKTKTPDSHDSFEIVDEPDPMSEFVVIEEVAKEADENDPEGRSIKITTVVKNNNKDDDYILESDENLVHSAPAKLTNILGDDDEEAPFQIDDIEGTCQLKKYVVENQNWMYEMEFERPLLEDIKEEELESSRIGSMTSQKGSLIGSAKGSSSSSDYDVLAGRKFFSKFFENDNQSLSSLQEFEQIERVISLENRRKLMQGNESLDSINNSNIKKFPLAKSLQGDNLSVSSLKDFESLESSCAEADEIERRAKETEETLLKVLETSADSLEPEKRENTYATRDSLDKIDSNIQMTSSTDSLELQTRIRIGDNFDSLEFQPTCQDSLELSNDSIDEEGAFNSDLTTSTNATYQLESADSILSSSFTSTCSVTMAQTIEPIITRTSTSPLHFDSSSSESTTKKTIEDIINDPSTSKPIVREIIEPCENDPEFSHTVHRYVEMPPEIQKVSFTGPNADEKMKQFLDDFQEGEYVHEEETIDADGNIHVTKVIQQRVLVRSDSHEQSTSSKKS